MEQRKRKSIDEEQGNHQYSKNAKLPTVLDDIINDEDEASISASKNQPYALPLHIDSLNDAIENKYIPTHVEDQNTDSLIHTETSNDIARGFGEPIAQATDLTSKDIEDGPQEDFEPAIVPILRASNYIASGSASGKPTAQATHTRFIPKDIIKYGTTKELESVFNTSEKRKQITGVILENFKSLYHISKDQQYKLDEQWEKIFFIADGGYGSVWRCMDIKTKKEFCMKEILSNDFRKEEVLCWIKIDNNNKNICELHGAEKSLGKVFIFMEMGGRSLRDVIKKQRRSKFEGVCHQRLTLEKCLIYLEQLLSALCALQDSRIIHHDIKTKNILIDEDKEKLKLIHFVKLVDFGESKEEQTTVLTKERNLIDVINATWVFREMLTGYRKRDPTYSKGSSGTGIFSGDMERYNTHWIDLLRLPEEVKAIFAYGWQRDVNKRWFAKDFLEEVKKVKTDLLAGTITYQEPEPMVIDEEEEGDFDATQERNLRLKDNAYNA